MHMKIEINHPENIPPPQKSFKSPEQTQNTKHFRKHLYPSKKFKPLPEKSQPPWKTPPPPK